MSCCRRVQWAKFVVRIADAFGLDQPHAVGPDIGTGALLFAASAHPGRFRSLVVGSGGASYPLELGEPLTGWVGALDLSAFRRIDPRQIVSAAVGGIEPTYSVPEWIREDYLSAYLMGSEHGVQPARIRPPRP
jgi:pimeloyl-ACP methyl ester carboxylesterase